MGQELRDKYPIYPRSCPQEGEVGHTHVPLIGALSVVGTECEMLWFLLVGRTLLTLRRVLP